MNRNLRKEVTIPLIILSAFVIAIFAGLTTYHIVEGKDECKCECFEAKKEFDVGTKIDNNDVPMLDKKYTEGASGYYYLIYDENTKEVKMAPSNYDRDAHDSFKDKIKDIEISKNVEVTNYNSEIIVKDTEMKQVITINDLSTSEFEYILENGSPCGFMWIDNNKITKILLFGEIIIYE